MEEEEERDGHSTAPPLPPSSSGETEPSDLSSTELHAQQQQQPHTHQTHRRHQHRRFLQDSPENLSYHFDLSEFDVAPSDTMDNIVWPCVAVLITLWLFATSITVILGFYGSWTLQLGPNCSRLITSINPFFVQFIQAQQMEGIPGPMVYLTCKVFQN